ncbi:aldolase/citrate lyase family protein [Mucilaginibacter sp.]|uniref:HpcH/HpaI aldolase family protein n=1 Tax=Mucilaginibacter sp. TaxID=1882438 RepID=UPI00261A99A6|nr:aldolase/citrate lyase family protein [Mucilaginibacter sp.]MDB4927215.1 4-hydroxy-2-oxovalerate aldolase [Mucilaginibacter sp.]
MKNLKKRLKNGETLNGCWLNLGSTITAEIVGLSGYDWVLLDLEHGGGSERDILNQLQALEHTPAAALVRVESTQRQRIQKVLDMGAEGIMCPHIDNAAEASEVAVGLHYPPHGVRGVAKMVRATGYGQNFADYYKNAQDDILGIVQIETAEALNNLDAIAAIDNIDVLFIGPNDLTMDMGIHGQYDHPLFKDALKRTVEAAEKVGKAAGILIFDVNDYQTYMDAGIRLIGCGADATFVANGALAMANQINTVRENSKK